MNYIRLPRFLLPVALGLLIAILVIFYQGLLSLFALILVCLSSLFLLRGKSKAALPLIIILLSPIIESILLKNALISTGDIINFLLYYSPYLLLIVGIFFNNKVKYNNMDYFALFIILFCLLEVSVSSFNGFPPNNKLAFFSLIMTPISIYGYYYYFNCSIKIDQFVKIVSISTFVVGLFGLLDIITNHKLLDYFGFELLIGVDGLDNHANTLLYWFGFPRMQSILGGPVALGWWMTFAIPLIARQYLLNKSKISLLLLILSFFCLIFSFARTAWFGVFFGLIIALLISRLFKGKHKLIILIFYCFLLFLLLVLFTPALQKMIISTINGTNSSSIGHYEASIGGLELLYHFPIFGTGTGSSPYFSMWSEELRLMLVPFMNGLNAESSIIDIAIQFGIVGLSLFLIFWIGMFKRVFKILDNLDRFIIIWLSVGFLSHTLVDYAAYNAINSILYFGFLAICYRNKLEEKSRYNT